MTKFGEHLRFGIRKGLQQPVGKRQRQPGRRDHKPRPAVPVEHRGQRAGLRPVGEILLFFHLRDCGEIDVFRKGLLEEPLITHRLDRLLEPRGAERRDILRCGPLLRILDQALLEDPGVRRVDDREPGQPLGPFQRRRPGDRTTPVMADQSESLEAQRIRQVEYVVDEHFGPVRLFVLRPVGTAKAALIGHHEVEAVMQLRDQRAPRAVRFRKSVEKDHRRRLLITGEADVQGNVVRNAQAGEGKLRHGHSVASPLIVFDAEC